MENNLDNRSRFVALHYGGDLVFVKGNYNYKTGSTIKIDADAIKYFASPTAGLRSARTAVLLTPLSQITDEDANSITIYGTYDKASFNDLGYNTPSGRQHYAIDSVDFLRSKGYAMRWMGVPVKTLVEWGWVKLKDTNNE